MRIVHSASNQIAKTNRLCATDGKIGQFPVRLLSVPDPYENHYVNSDINPGNLFDLFSVARPHGFDRQATHPIVNL
jgi:hypothetical protein